MARAYRHRPPYPDEVFGVLNGLITGRPRTVLDLSAGEGALARPLAGRTDHVDALDISAAMVDETSAAAMGANPLDLDNAEDLPRGRAQDPPQ